MVKISAYTILYYDLQFYEDIIKRIYDIVDEIVIVDGPYSYAIETLKQFNLFYDEEHRPSEINYILENYPKVKYRYVICDTEEEKRTIGYNMCSNDIILIVDTDEFLNINTNALHKFINNNNKYVCNAVIYNMCDYNINFNKPTNISRLFKKNIISALEHLDYTWLIGCKQNNRNYNYISNEPFGILYHQTLCRKKQNNIIKFIFYVLLYRKHHTQNYDIIDNYDNTQLLEYLNIEEVLNIFVRSRIDSINIPPKSNDTILELMDNNEDVTTLKKYDNLPEFQFSTRMKCLKSSPVFFRLNKVNEHITILFGNVKNVNISVHKIYLYTSNRIIESNEYNNIVDNKVVLNTSTSGNEKYIVLEIKCTETCTNSYIFTIENII
jgi:hypothetical protein